MSNGNNRYDFLDTVKRVSLMRAGPLKFAAYKVRDIETGEWSKLQFHMTYDNTVYGVMGEEAFKLFARLGNEALEREYAALEALPDQGAADD